MFELQMVPHIQYFCQCYCLVAKHENGVPLLVNNSNTPSLVIKLSLFIINFFLRSSAILYLKPFIKKVIINDAAITMATRCAKNTKDDREGCTLQAEAMSVGHHRPHDDLLWAGYSLCTTD